MSSALSATHLWQVLQRPGEHKLSIGKQLTFVFLRAMDTIFPIAWDRWLPLAHTNRTYSGLFSIGQGLAKKYRYRGN